MESEGLRIVQSFYDLLGKGDISGALELLDDDVRWELQGPPEIPFARKTDGKEAVVEFFTAISEHGELESYQVNEFIAQDDKVVALGEERIRARATGKSFEMEFADVFVVRDGKIVWFREYCDTGSMAKAYTSE